MLKVNDYRMMGDSLVRISGVTDTERYTVQFVQIVTHDGVKAISGGGSTWHGEEKFSPITDPKLVAAAQAFEANRRYEELDGMLDKAWQEVQRWNGVLQCIHEAKMAGEVA